MKRLIKHLLPQIKCKYISIPKIFYFDTTIRLVNFVGNMHLQLNRVQKETLIAKKTCLLHAFCSPCVRLIDRQTKCFAAKQNKIN